MNKYAIILAAGKGSRMKSLDPNRSKMTFPILGKPLVRYVIDAVKELGISKIVTVVGFGGEGVKELVKDDTEVVWQKDVSGTGNAVLQAKSILKDKNGTTLIVYGHTPLISVKTLKNVVNKHENDGNDMTITTAFLENGMAYGRIIREKPSNKILAIKENDECTSRELAINEVNTGICVFNNKVLFEIIDELDNNNSQHEYYLTKLVEILVNKKYKVGAYVVPDAREIFGINDRSQLAYASKFIKRKVNEKLMLSGVSLEDPDTTYISPDVTIGKDTVIGPNTIILGHTTIGKSNFISQNSYLENVTIGDNNKILSSYLTDVTIGKNNEIGPYTKMRTNTVIKDNCRIGNFVELKNAILNNGVKSAHLTYVGDAEVGERTNIGCMTVTANYDGYNKSRTSIGKDCFVGSGTILVAPIKMEDESFSAAGSVITSTIHKDEMAIARARQVNKARLRSIFLAKAKAKKEVSLKKGKNK